MLSCRLIPILKVLGRRGWHMPFEMGNYGHQRASQANGLGVLRAEEKVTVSGCTAAAQAR